MPLDDAQDEEYCPPQVMEADSSDDDKAEEAELESTLDLSATSDEDRELASALFAALMDAERERLSECEE